MICQCQSSLAAIIDKYIMKDLNTIGEELFDKLRGRFQSVTIGGEDGKVTNIPTEARFFDFEYTANGSPLGNISVSISEDEGLTVIYSKDIVATVEEENVKSDWFDFLKELRRFSKKRLMDFDIRDITKSNLTKRDYKFLANKRFGDGNMNESKLYGTARTSYQKVGEARIMIKHTENVNLEVANPRTKKISNIYIESAQGERFKYPFKHLSGARAMARHVAEGGNLYDDFGSHIIGLSEEMAKLRKFKSYMGRSAVMAESLSEYVDVVKDRINTVRKTITALQKPKFYAEAFAAYETPIMEEVPADVAENWTDQLTIKQFNEELADVFPYIYKLVSEATKAQELGLEDLVDESALMAYAGNKKHGKEYMLKAAAAGREGASQEELGALKDKYSKAEKNKKTKEEIAVEQGFEEMMGQFAESPQGQADGEMKRDNAASLSRGEVKAQRKSTRAKQRVANKKAAKVDEAYINNAKDAVDALGQLRSKGKQIERGDGTYEGNLANEYVNDVWDVYTWLQNKTQDFQGMDKNAKATIDAMMKLRSEAKKLETEAGSGSNGRFGNAIVNTLYPVMELINSMKLEDDDTMDVKIDPKTGTMAKADAPEEKKEKTQTPISEFILSYFDKETGQFPKGETAVLTMIEKDYGEQFIDPAKSFIEKVTARFEEHQMRTQPQQMETDDEEFDRVRQLAGLR
jgi:hypothetical protein